MNLWLNEEVGIANTLATTVAREGKLIYAG